MDKKIRYEVLKENDRKIKANWKETKASGVYKRLVNGLIERNPDIYTILEREYKEVYPVYLDTREWNQVQSYNPTMIIVEEDMGVILIYFSAETEDAILTGYVWEDKVYGVLYAIQFHNAVSSEKERLDWGE